MTTYIIVSSGATSRNLTVSSGFDLEVESGGAVGSVTVLSGGFEDVSGKAVEETLSAGADVAIRDGAQLMDAKALSGSELYLNAGAMAKNVVAFSGATVTAPLSISGGETFDLAQSSLTSSMDLDGATLRRGAIFTPFYVQVASGGVLSLGAAAGVFETTVDGGGVVEGPGTLFGDTVVNGMVSGASLASAAYDGAYAEVMTGGTLSNVSVGADFAVYADDRGRTVGLNLAGSNSFEYVNGGGAAIHTVVHSGGVLVASSGARLSNDVVMSGGAISTINATDALSGVTLESGAEVFNDYFIYEGSISGVTIQSGAYLALYQASASGVTVSGGGVEDVYTLSPDTGAVLVGSSGAALPSAGENETGFGYQFIEKGTARKAVVESGGFQEVAYRGISQNAVVHAGGVVRVDSGGKLLFAQLDSGADLVVEPRASEVGSLSLQPGAKIDLAQVAATSAGVVSGQFVVSDEGTVVDRFGLRGSTADLGFSVVSDGRGGTDLIVTGGGAGAAALTSAMATLAPDGAAAGPSGLHDRLDAHRSPPMPGFVAAPASPGAWPCFQAPASRE